MSRVQKVIVYEEGVAICEDDLGKFLFEYANVKITPLPEPRKCYLTGSERPIKPRVLEVELEMA